MIIPTLFWLAPLGVVIWGVVRLTSGRGASSGRNVMQAPPDLTAEEILKRRYASGEIDAQTYESMRERLTERRISEVPAPRG